MDAQRARNAADVDEDVAETLPRVEVIVYEEATVAPPTVVVKYGSTILFLEPLVAIMFAVTIAQSLQEQVTSEITLFFAGHTIRLYRHEAYAVAFDVAYAAGMLRVSEAAGDNMVRSGLKPKLVTKGLRKAINWLAEEKGIEGLTYAVVDGETDDVKISSAETKAYKYSTTNTTNECVICGEEIK